ncbi:MAG: class I SAM-dependent methyltransferase [Methylococcaceae bacterium]|nr:class I SAM-dependent methyltransferase [Methylococcaceae bacterium]
MDQRSKALQNEYQKRFELNALYREAVWQILCRDFFSSYINQSAILLDLGAGWGEFSRNIKAKKKYAMDLNPDCGNRVYGYAEFLQQDCSTAWPLQDDSLDVVFTSNFLEHLPSKAAIDLTLQEAFRCLKKGGTMICLGPNIKYLPGTYWDYWDHYVPITDASMTEALSLQGFNVNEVVDRFLPYTMSDGSTPPLFALKIYLRMRVIWPLFGKQFFIVAKK